MSTLVLVPVLKSLLILILVKRVLIPILNVTSKYISITGGVSLLISVSPVHFLSVLLPHRVTMVSLICTVKGHLDDVNCCTFSASLLATCSADKTVRVYSTRDFSELPFSPLSGHGYGVHCCCFSPCGQYLASCSTDATTVVWAMSTGEIEAVLEHPGRSPVRVCAFSPDSSCLISGASDGTVALWDVPSRTLRRSVFSCCLCKCCAKIFTPHVCDWKI